VFLSLVGHGILPHFSRLHTIHHAACLSGSLCFLVQAEQAEMPTAMQGLDVARKSTGKQMAENLSRGF
jgi:hypothetical protein